MSLTIELCGISFGILGDAAATLERQGPEFIPFTLAGPPDVSIELSVVPKVRYRHYSSKTYPLPVTQPSPHRLLIHWQDLDGEYRINDRRFSGTISDGGRGLNSLIRILLSMHISELGGMLVHGASIAAGGSAYVLAGVSGSGKSTAVRATARRHPQHHVLTDEASIIRFDSSGRANAFGSPFWGDVDYRTEPVSFPVAGMYFIRGAPRPYRVELDRNEATARLMRCALCYSSIPKQIQAVMENCTRLLASVDVAEVGTDLGGDFWDYLDRSADSSTRHVR